ncbi:MAG: hypothetical protein Q9159_003288 [Coniocarpon cinnabarinum]
MCLIDEVTYAGCGDTQHENIQFCALWRQTLRVCMDADINTEYTKPGKCGRCDRYKGVNIIGPYKGKRKGSGGATETPGTSSGTTAKKASS